MADQLHSPAQTDTQPPFQSHSRVGNGHRPPPAPEARGLTRESHPSGSWHTPCRSHTGCCGCRFRGRRSHVAGLLNQGLPGWSIGCIKPGNGLAEMTFGLDCRCRAAATPDRIVYRHHRVIGRGPPPRTRPVWPKSGQSKSVRSAPHRDGILPIGFSSNIYSNVLISSEISIISRF